MNDEPVRARQSRVAKSGNSWEEYVRLFLNEKLEGTGIEVIVGKYEENIKKRSPTLWKLLNLPQRSSLTQEYVWGDVDLVAVKGDLPISVISCKTSLHGRFTETLFWSLLFRTVSQIKVVFATPDAGAGKTGELKSEWGTPEEPSKDRMLAESYLSGVYVENVPEFCPLKKPTALGGIVRPLSELPDDLKRWFVDISRVVGREDSGSGQALL